MSAEQWTEIVKTLGVSGPLVAILLYLLRQMNEERKSVTTQFLDALRTTVEQSNEARVRAANELSQLVTALRDHQERSGDEHNRIVDAIGKLGVRERSP